MRLGARAIVALCIIVSTATATTATTAAAPPTCSNDICHVRTIKGGIVLKGVNCAKFEASPALIISTKTTIARLSQSRICGIASERDCTPDDVNLLCTDLTSQRRLLSSGNSIGITYTIVVGDAADTSAATSTLSNITAVSSALTSMSEFSGITVTAGTAPYTGTMDSASGRAVCKGFSLFPSAGGASAGNCTDPMFGGDVCSPVCDSHSVLTSKTTCSVAGVIQQATCSTKGCTCQNGIGSTGSNCPEHETAHCASCNVGYHLVAGVCVQNVCRCPNGRPVLGTACITHNAVHCRDCQSGHHLGGTSAKPSCVACTAGHYQSTGNFSGTSCTPCAKGTAVQGTANTACTPCTPGASGTYTDQTGQATCTPHPALIDAELQNCVLPQSVASLPTTTERRKCVPPSCERLSHYYSEGTMECATKCRVPNAVATDVCTKTKKRYKELLCHKTHCRRRRTRL